MTKHNSNTPPKTTRQLNRETLTTIQVLAGQLVDESKRIESNQDATSYCQLRNIQGKLLELVLQSQKF